ncbi:hypothetical protein [Acanthopleuribacter pedis]|uniref:Uncharacterized protein n=1 Tax=Acanthopleuribacter pedis TaxID=442870 RepID=A0A8J7QGN4_9BACT|nr:hypothetical protein [Acanthopleuribacter pedis]MBO1321960.1 hypothetical protein [Acanthopleuribacter pedis]
MLFLLTLALLSQTPANPETPTAQAASAKLTALDQKLAAVTQQQKFLETQFGLGDAKLDTKIEKEMAKLERTVISWNSFVAIAHSLLVANLFCIIGAFWKAKTLLRKEMERKYRDDWKALETLIDKQNLQEKLVIETRILLLSSAVSSETKHRLRRWGMTLVATQDPDSFQTNPTPDAYDLILFDQVDAATVNKVMAAHPRVYCVAFSPERLLGLAYQDRINLANSPITLFTRILETARFRLHQIGEV